MSPQTDDLLKVREVAKALNVSTETVHRWTRLGKIRHVVLPSGTIRFRRADIEALIDGGEASS